MTTKEKILQYIEYKRISKRDFYRQTGFSNGFLDSGKHLGSNYLKIIIDKFPDLNLEWLVMDIGEMLKKEQQTNGDISNLTDVLPNNKQKTEDEISNIKERVLYLSENIEVSKQRFFQNIGITYGNFTGEKKKRPLNSDAIENILLNYPQTNPEWLLTGKGEMLRSKEADGPKIEYKDKYLKALEEKDALYKENIKLLKEIDVLKEQLKEFKNIKNTA